MTDVGSQWADFVEDQLTREFDRRGTLDTKGLAIVTSSGTLVSLVFAIGAIAIARKDTNFIPTATIAVPATLSLILFVIAATLGLFATRVIEYSVADPRSLEKMRTEHWKLTDTQARSVVMWYKIGTLKDVRAGNNSKAMLVLYGLLTEVSAVAVLAIGVGAALWVI